MTGDGWIKMYRKLLDWEWYDKSEMVHLFIDLLLNANSKDAKWRGADIPKGSLVTSLDKLSQRTGISVRTIRTCLGKFEQSGEIKQKTTNQYRLITITNYEDYQEQTTGRRQTTDKQPTNNRQTTDNKQEYKNIEYTTIPDGIDSIVVDDTLIDIKRGIVKGGKWKEDFEVYKSGLRQAYSHIIKDSAFIADQQKFHPGVNIKLTLEKACTTFWATEAGWKNKKSKRTKSIDWRQTLINALSQPQNKVYEQRNNTPAGRVAEKRESLGELERAALECLFGSQGENRK